jgi:hypothetical protein
MAVSMAPLKVDQKAPHWAVRLVHQMGVWLAGLTAPHWAVPMAVPSDTSELQTADRRGTSAAKTAVRWAVHWVDPSADRRDRWEDPSADQRGRWVVQWAAHSVHPSAHPSAGQMARHSVQRKAAPWDKSAKRWVARTAVPTVVHLAHYLARSSVERSAGLWADWWALRKADRRAARLDKWARQWVAQKGTLATHWAGQKVLLSEFAMAEQ